MTFPLHVETYRIGNRCYRRNPYKVRLTVFFLNLIQPAVNSKTNNDVGDTPDLYPEEDEAEDGPSCAYIQGTDFLLFLIHKINIALLNLTVCSL